MFNFIKGSVKFEQVNYVVKYNVVCGLYTVVMYKSFEAAAFTSLPANVSSLYNNFRDVTLRPRLSDGNVGLLNK